MSKAISSDPCRAPQLDSLETLESIINSYIAEHRSRGESETHFYQLQKRRGKLIDYAGMAKTDGERRHPHQYRITKATLQTSTSRLKNIDFSSCGDFDVLFELVEQTIGDIPGIGELTVYDTATRIAAGYGIEPNKVYLHAGTRVGAKALSLDRGQSYLEINELPRAFHKLKAREIEDCLCIYKKDLQRLETYG